MAEAEANRATEAAAEANARAQAAAQLLTQAELRANRLNEQFRNVSQERERVAAQQVDPARGGAGDAGGAEAEAALTAARAAVEQAEQARAATATALASARDKQATADSARARLAAEAQALAEVLAVKDGERWPPMIDSLTVADGLEAALGRGAGGGTDLGAESGRGAALAGIAGVRSGSRVAGRGDAAGGIGAGAARFGAGVVADWSGRERRRKGDRQSVQIAPGQSLVSRAGAIWRWDGYTIRAGTPTQAAVRLQQRNRLIGLRTRLAAAEQEAARRAGGAVGGGNRLAGGGDRANRASRNSRREWEQKLERARASLASLRNQAATATARLAAADDQLARVTVERDEALAALAQVRESADRPARHRRTARRRSIGHGPRCRLRGRRKTPRAGSGICWRGTMPRGSIAGG